MVSLLTDGLILLVNFPALVKNEKKPFVLVQTPSTRMDVRERGGGGGGRVRRSLLIGQGPGSATPRPVLGAAGGGEGALGAMWEGASILSLRVHACGVSFHGSVPMWASGSSACALERVHEPVIEGVGRRARSRPQGPWEPHQFALTPVAEAAEDDSDAKADGDDGRDQQDIAGGRPWRGHTQVRPSLARASYPPSAQSPPEQPPYPHWELCAPSSTPSSALLADLGKSLPLSASHFPHL